MDGMAIADHSGIGGGVDPNAELSSVNKFAGIQLARPVFHINVSPAISPVRTVASSRAEPALGPASDP